MSESDFLDEKGDRWLVRKCDDESGCVVIERFMLRNPPQGLDKLVDDFAREATGQPPRATEEVPDDEADDDIHIPAGVVQAIAAALASSKPGGIRLALEQLAEEPLVANGCPRCFDSRYIARKALADLESSKPSPAFVACGDANVDRVCEALRERSRRGQAKYGTTTERTDIDLAGWLQHLQEELLDASVYVERLKAEVALALAEKEAGHG